MTSILDVKSTTQLNFAASARYKTKQEIAYDTLRSAIITCELSPGDPLIIRRLAAQLNISEIPVREALKTLVAENFVLEQGSNLFVAPITAEEFWDMLEVRLGLERLAIKMAAKKMDEKKSAELLELIEKMREYYDSENTVAYNAAHDLFHLKAVTACGVSYLNSALEEAFAHHKRGRNYFKLSYYKGSPNFQAHEEIVQALQNHDEELAEQRLLENRIRPFDLYRSQMLEIMKNDSSD